MDTRHADRMPLDKLAKLVEKLSPQQILNIPLDRLPKDLPADWIGQFDADKARVLHDLRAKMHDPKALALAQAVDSVRVNNALHWLRRSSTMDHWLDEFVASLGATESEFSRWREQNERMSSSGTWQSVDALGAEITMASSESLKFSVLTIRCRHLEESLRAHEASILKYTRLLAALDKRAQRGELPDYAADTLGRAKHNLVRLQDYLSRTRMLRLYVTHNEMLAVSQRIDSVVDHKHRLDQNIRRVAAEINHSGGWLRRLGRRDRQQTLFLNDILKSMRGEKLRLRVDISDQALEQWINVLVDATIDSNCQTLARSRIDAARTLLVSLIKYRRRTASARIELEHEADQSATTEITQELQQLLCKSFASIKPDALLLFRSQQRVFHSRVQQLQNQVIDEVLATTAPRHAIES